MRIEEIALRQEASQMLCEVGLNKEKLKELVLKDKEENQLNIIVWVGTAICIFIFIDIFFGTNENNVFYYYIKNNKTNIIFIKSRYFDSKTLDLLMNVFTPLNDIYDRFKSADKTLKRELKNLYIKYDIQLSGLKDSLINIQKMLKHSDEIEKQEIYIKIKKDIKKDIKPLIRQIETDSKIIISNHEKYLNDKDNAIRQLTKKELENKVLFNINKIELDELKKKY